MLGSRKKCLGLRVVRHWNTPLCVCESVQGYSRWDFEQPDLEGGVLAHGWGIGTR